MKTGLSIAIVATAAALAAAPASACTRSGYRYGMDYASATSRWTVNRNKPCRGYLNVGNLYLVGLTFIEKPKHGIAGSASRYQYAYQPDKDYVGPDRFVMRIEFNLRGVNGHTDVTFNVNVR